MSNSQIDRALAKQLVKVADNYERMIKAEARVKELEAASARKEPTMNNDEVLKLGDSILEAYDYGQFSDDFDRPLAKPIRKNLRDLCELLRNEKLRAKDAELIKAISDAHIVAEQIIVWKNEEIEGLRKLITGEQEINLKMAETIAQQKEEIAGLEEIYTATNKALNHVTNELSATQAWEADLVEVLQDIASRSKLIDYAKIDDALFNSTKHTERVMAEVKAKTLEDAATFCGMHSDASACECPATAQYCETGIRSMANELREVK